MSENSTVPAETTSRAPVTLQAAGIAALCEEWSTTTIRRLAAKYGVSKSDLHRFMNLPEHREMYEAAKLSKASTLAEEALEIADDTSQDQIEDGEDGIRTNHEAISRSKLKVDVRKWYASKLDPQSFGEKQQPLVNISVTGAHLDALRVVNGNAE